jgi:hypothetical protein
VHLTFVVSLVYPLAAFGYGNLVYPLPKRKFWNMCMIYTILLLLLKFFFRLPFFCVCQGEGLVRLACLSLLTLLLADGNLNVIPFCSSDTCNGVIVAGYAAKGGVYWQVRRVSAFCW